MVEFFTETLYKKVWVFGYKSSLSASLHEKASPGCVHFIDDIWDSISIPVHKTQAERLQDLRKPVEKLIWAPDVEGACSCISEDDPNLGEATSGFS